MVRLSIFFKPHPANMKARIVDPSLASPHELFALGFLSASLKLELELRPLLGLMFLVYPPS